MVSAKTLRERWQYATETGCPYQRYSAGHGVGVWLSERIPPCHAKVCGQPGCYQYGKPWAPPGRRWYFVPAGRTRVYRDEWKLCVLGLACIVAAVVVCVVWALS